MSNKFKTSEDEFHRLVGACIKRWAGIESAMFDICDLTLDAGRRLAAVVFFRTPNIESRLTLVSDLLYARLLPNGLKSGEHLPPTLKRWEKIEQLVRDNIPFRNFVAHNPVTATHTGVYTGVPGTTPEDYVTYFVWEIVEHGDDAQRPRSRPPKIKKADLPAMEAHLEVTSTFYKTLSDFTSDLLKLPVEQWRSTTGLEGRKHRSIHDRPSPTKPTYQPRSSRK